MNRIYFAITLLGILSFVSLAQNSIAQTADKPDFTGTWELQNKKSVPPEQRTLIINQAGDELTLTENLEFKGKIVSHKTTLYLNQRGERNLLLMPGADFAVEVKSTTSWKKDKLIRKLTFSTPLMIGSNRYTEVVRQTHTYSLSKDGNLLTVEILDFSENPLDGMPKIASDKRVYLRKK